MSILLALAAAAAVPQPQASIPFFSTVSSPDWRIDGDKGMWIRPNSRQWYYATFMGPCPRADFALRLGFKTGTMDTFDRFSTVYADGDICPLTSLVKSDAPPPAKLKAAKPKG
jgi:hypothetical protein